MNQFTSDGAYAFHYVPTSVLVIGNILHLVHLRALPKTRLGNIARLPSEIGEQLNVCLQNREFAGGW
jgi:hypothetical protein